MRKFMWSALLGIGALGLNGASSTDAKASWLSEIFENSRVQVNIGPQQYPAYGPGRVYAPAPVPSYYHAPAYSYRPVPVYYAAPVRQAPAYRPGPAPVPQNSYYGPNRHGHGNHDGPHGRPDHSWYR